MKILGVVMLVGLCCFLVACAVQPNNDYDLTADEMKNVGNATMTQQQSVPTLYDHAEFAQTKAKGTV